MTRNPNTYPCLAVVLASVIWLCSLDPSHASFALTIGPDDEECFVIRTPVDRASVITGSYDCLDDDMEVGAFSASITDYVNGEFLYQGPTGAREGTFKIDEVPPNSRYALCFQNNDEANTDDDDDEFDVGFSIRVSNLPRGLEDGEIGPDSERALKLVEKASDIHQDWGSMADHYDFVRNREAIHQEMNDAILSRLTRWTYIEAFLVISMATGQVMYWKKFFETTRYL